MRRFLPDRRASIFAVAWLLLSACAPQKPPAPASIVPTSHSASDSSAIEKLSITVYNQNFGLVREIRSVHVGLGTVELAYHDVSAHIQPESVHLRGLPSPDALTVLEQNYRYDLLSPDNLLKKYLGKQVKVYRYNEHTGVDWTTLPLAPTIVPVPKLAAPAIFCALSRASEIRPAKSQTC